MNQQWPSTGSSRRVAFTRIRHSRKATTDVHAVQTTTTTRCSNPVHGASGIVMLLVFFAVAYALEPASPLAST